MKRLLVTGDDFGLALEVNEAIERAYGEGVLRTASLMVGGAAAEDAVARAHAMPGLGVGLHLVLVEGRPTLDQEQVSMLLDPQGVFLEDFVRAGFRFFFRPGIRRQLAAEIRAQFEAFRATGLELDHVNAHNHMHLHPTILGLLIEIGRDYGLPPIRFPREHFRWNPGSGWLRETRRAMGDLALSPWMALLRRRLRTAGVLHNDQVLGNVDSGHMNEETVLRLLDTLPAGTTEMYFHPAVGRCAEIERVSPGTQYNGELTALLSPRVRERIETLAVEPLRFRDLGRPLSGD